MDGRYIKYQNVLPITFILLVWCADVSEKDASKLPNCGTQKFLPVWWQRAGAQSPSKHEEETPSPKHYILYGV